MENFIGFKCQNYIPDDLIQEIKKIWDDTCLNVQVEIKKEQRHYFDSVDIEFSDIIIYIKHHQDLFISGLLLPLFYDTLKLVIKTIWQRLKNLPIKRIVNKNEIYDKQKSIKLIYQQNDNSKTEISIEGEITNEQIDNIIEEFFNLNKYS